MSTAGPFSSDRYVLHYRAKSVELAMAIFEQGFETKGETLMGLSAIIWGFLQDGTVPAKAESDELDWKSAALISAEVYRALQELTAAMGKK